MGYLRVAALALLASLIGRAPSAEAGEVSQEMLKSGAVAGVERGHTVPTLKRSVLVRLNKRLEADQLEALANDIRSDDPDYKRTFIEYLLPGMEEGAGAWATSHFDPSLKVIIHGPTEAQIRELSEVPDVKGRTIVGAWLHEWTSASSRIVIYREKGKLFAEKRYLDGSGSARALRDFPAPRGATRYEEVGGNVYGEHFIVTRWGVLEYRDREGVIGTSKKLR